MRTALYLSTLGSACALLARAQTCAPNTPPSSAGKLRFTGINIPGFDFGCNSDGNCHASGAWPPLLQYYGQDGQGQMNHFVKDDGFNVFRLPVGWQFLVNDVEGGPIVEANFQEYDALVQACVNSGAEACIIDIHNYARWNGAVGVLYVYLTRETSLINTHLADHWAGWAYQRPVCSFMVRHRDALCE